MLIELLTENENVEKSRKSLMATSIFVPLFAVIKFTSEELSIFGLTIQVSQQRLVQIGQLAIAYLLFVFVIRLLPGLIGWIHEFLETRDKAWAEKIVDSFNNDYDPSEDYGPEPEDYEMRFYDERNSREARRHRVKAASNFLSNSVVTLLNFSAPIGFGLAATIQPYYLNSILSFFS